MLDMMIRRGYDALDVMEKHLASREWFVGNSYSIADIALYAYTHVADEGGFDLGKYPAIRAMACASKIAAAPPRDHRAARLSGEGLARRAF